MRSGVLLAPVLMLMLDGGCGSRTDRTDATTGARLEAAALEAGLIAAAEAPVTGVWARDADRMCVAAPNGRTGAQRVGLFLDDGAGGRCIAAGTARRRDAELFLDLGRCRVQVRLDGARAVLPERPNPACAALCRGSATLSAVPLERVGDTASEAAAMRLPDGRSPCAG